MKQMAAAVRRNHLGRMRRPRTFFLKLPRAGPDFRGGRTARCFGTSARGRVLKVKFTGMAQNLVQLLASYRDSQSNCWAN
jgi:hypothetical protein